MSDFGSVENDRQPMYANQCTNFLINRQPIASNAQYTGGGGDDAAAEGDGGVADSIAAITGSGRVYRCGASGRRS